MNFFLDSYQLSLIRWESHSTVTTAESLLPITAESLLTCQWYTIVLVGKFVDISSLGVPQIAFVQVMTLLCVCIYFQPENSRKEKKNPLLVPNFVCVFVKGMVKVYSSHRINYVRSHMNEHSSVPHSQCSILPINILMCFPSFNRYNNITKTYLKIISPCYRKCF